MTATASAPIPGPSTIVPITHLLLLRRDRLEFMQKLAIEYGDIANFHIGPQNVVLLNHPDYIRDVLVTHHKNFMKGEGLQRAKRLLGEGLLTSEGEFHLRQRRLAQPAFHRQRINEYATTMIEYAERSASRWQFGQTYDVAREMMHLTLAIAGKTLFDADVEAEADEIGEALSDSMKMFDRLTLPFSSLLERLPLPANKRFNQARERLDATIYRMINERRNNPTERGDLLSLLMNARDDEGDGTGMTDEQLRDEAMTIFLAGHETTANALAWTWYLLAQNPEIEKRFHDELDNVLQGRNVAPSDYPQLRYTEMILAESMRMYPPAWIIGRKALNDYQCGAYLIPKNTLVLMSQFVTHHDARWFPDPNTFNPERWTPEAKEARPKFSYYPFGGGNRVCIGEQFAWMEGVLVLAAIGQRWRMCLASDAPVEMKASVTLRPKGGLPMRIENR